MSKLKVADLRPPAEIKTRFVSAKQGYRFAVELQKNGSLWKYAWKNAPLKKDALGIPAISFTIEWSQEEADRISFELHENVTWSCKRVEHLVVNFDVVNLKGPAPLKTVERGNFNQIKKKSIQWDLHLERDLGELPSVDEFEKLLVPLRHYYKPFEKKIEMRLIERNREAALEFYRAVLRAVDPIVAIEDIDAIYHYDA
jgi:hypothetical protein